MNPMPIWMPSRLRQVTPIQLFWSVAASAWIAGVASWRWPLFQPKGYAHLATAAQFVACFIVCLLAMGVFFSAVQTAAAKVVESKNINHIPRLDHLRFFAAALIVLYHFYHSAIPLEARGTNVLLNVISEGSSAVAIFFVLSGFIFGLIGYDKKIRYVDFVWSRVIRIYPLYIFALLLLIGANRNRFSSVDFITLLFPVFDSGSLPGLPGFGQLWTVGLEFQFYLIFPFLAAFVARNGYRYLLGLVLLAIGLRVLYFVQTGSVRDISYWTLLGRIDEFALGIGAAAVYMRRRHLFSNPLHLVLAIALALGALQWLVAWGGYFNGAKSILWVVWPTIGGLVWAYLLLSYVSCRIRMPGFLDKSLDKLGALSFSIYVMHSFALYWTQKYWAVWTFTKRTDLDAALRGILICLPLAVGIAWCTYHLIEKQFFVFRRKYVEPIAARP